MFDENPFAGGFWYSPGDQNFLSLSNGFFRRADPEADYGILLLGLELDPYTHAPPFQMQHFHAQLSVTHKFVKHG